MPARPNEMEIVVKAKDEATRTIKGVEKSVNQFGKNVKRDLDSVEKSAEKNKKSFEGIAKALILMKGASNVFRMLAADSQLFQESQSKVSETFGNVFDGLIRKLREVSGAQERYFGPMEKQREELRKMQRELLIAENAVDDLADAEIRMEPVIVEATRTIDEQAEALKQWEAAMEEHKRLLDEIASSIAGNFTDSFFEIIEGTKSVAQAFTDMVTSILKDLGRMFIQQGLTSLLGGLFSNLFPGPSMPFAAAGGGVNIFGQGAARQSGGQVNAGQRYTVGERGPETFVPQTGGRIIPQGGGGPMNITFNIQSTDPRTSAREVKTALMQLLGTDRQVRQSVRSA